MRHKGTVAHLDVNRHGRLNFVISKCQSIRGEQRLTGALFRDGSNSIAGFIPRSINRWVNLFFVESYGSVMDSSEILSRTVPPFSSAGSSWDGS